MIMLIHYNLLFISVWTYDCFVYIRLDYHLLVLWVSNRLVNPIGLITWIYWYDNLYSYIHSILIWWVCGPNKVDQDMVGIRLWFAQNTHIFHYKSQTQQRDKWQRCQYDPVVVTTTIYMCFNPRTANNLVCKFNGIVGLFFLVQEQSILPNYGNSNCDYEDGFYEKLGCNIYKLQGIFNRKTK